MAVYTPLEPQQVATFIKPFGIGELVDMEGVADGVENTNYFISTDHAQLISEERNNPIQYYVLTLFESLSSAELAFYVDFTDLLGNEGLPVPSALRDSNGVAIHSLAQKPALLLPKLAGAHPAVPSLEQCTAIGQALARLHRVSQASAYYHHGTRDLAWLAASAETMTNDLEPHDADLLGSIRQAQQAVADSAGLPQAVIHGDLFRDNCLFEGDELTGLIDFYSASTGHLLLDLAVTVNDWCSMADGSLDLERCHALVSAYRQRRPITDNEREHWNHFLILAAARFWLSRLNARLHPGESAAEGRLVTLKDPAQYRDILRDRVQHSNNLTAYL